MNVRKGYNVFSKRKGRGADSMAYRTGIIPSLIRVRDLRCFLFDNAEMYV